MTGRPNGPRSARRRDLAVLALILLVGMALRVAYLAELRNQPELEYPPVDSGFSLYWAKALATGDWSLPPQANGRDPEIRSTAYPRPPGYPFVLAGLYTVTGGSQLGIRALQMLVGLLGIVVAWWLGRALFDNTIATTWAALLACNWTLIYFAGGLDGIWLVVVLSLLLMLALHRFACRPTPARSAAVAALIGLIALIRPNILVLVPAVLVWGWWVLGRRQARRRLPALLGTAILVGGAILAPPVIRNLRVAGRFVPVAANSGITLFAGNNDRSTGVSTSQVAELGVFSSPWQMQDLVQRLSRETGQDLNFSDGSRLLGRRAAQWVLENPGRALRLYLRKAALFWGPQEIAHNRAVAVDRERSPLLKNLPMGFALALAGGLLGLIICIRRPPWGLEPSAAGDDTDTMPGRVAILLFVACWFLSFLPFFMASLYRVPVIPCLLLGCAVSVVHVSRLLRRRPAAAVALTGVLLIIWAVVRIPLVAVDRGEAKWHCNRAMAWSYQGQPARAEDEFRAAVAADPQSWIAHNGLGAVLFQAGRIDEAEQSFRRALAIEPADEVARFNLGLALARRGRWPDAAEELALASTAAPRNAQAHASLGVALEQLGRPAEAIAAYERALGADPSHRQAANNLAWALATGADATLRDGPRAVELAERLVREAPGPGSLDTLAAAYAECGRFDEAVASATLAVADSADNPVARAAFGERLQLYRERRPYRQQ